MLHFVFYYNTLRTVKSLRHSTTECLFNQTKGERNEMGFISETSCLARAV
jgi:hypothetical protein